MLLRVLADRQPLPCRFLLLGSASPDLMKKSSETLAGRVHFVDMSGFTLAEMGVERQTELWVRGGFPKSFLAEDEPRSVKWREDFMQTFLERDMPMLGIQVPPETLAPVLDDVGALSRADLERVGDRRVAGGDAITRRGGIWMR